MFGSNNRREVQRVLSRLLSRSAIERLDVRRETRSCQVMPVLLAADRDGEPATGEAVCGLITDVSSRGLGVYLQRLFNVDRLFIGLWLDENAQVLRGRVASNHFVGGGFYRAGLELLGVMAPSRMHNMESFCTLTAGLENPECFSLVG
jgi:hypothetical protein